MLEVIIKQLQDPITPLETCKAHRETDSQMKFEAQIPKNQTRPTLKNYCYREMSCRIRLPIEVPQHELNVYLLEESGAINSKPQYFLKFTIITERQCSKIKLLQKPKSTKDRQTANQKSFQAK